MMSTVAILDTTIPHTTASWEKFEFANVCDWFEVPAVHVEGWYDVPAETVFHDAKRPSRVILPVMPR